MSSQMTGLYALGAQLCAAAGVTAFALACAALLTSCAAPADAHDPEPGPAHYSESRPLMGTSFTIQVIADDPTHAARAMDAAFAEVARVEALLSEWRTTSEISAVNRRAGLGPTPVGPELLEVLTIAARIAHVTDGAFDPTFPTRSVHPWLDHRSILLDHDAHTVTLPITDMRLGLGGIGKGYGVDRAADVLLEQGIHRFVVDGGGDLRVQGRSLHGAWEIGLRHPGDPDTLLTTLRLTSGALVTSGDYERPGHIIDPTTGRPATRTASVTVTAPTATEADALATGLFVLGPRRGAALAESLPHVEALFVAPDHTITRTRGARRW